MAVQRGKDAAVELTAVTLRGLGSYLHGARLEIKPLTVLCGKNGSGKSTWLSALNMLERSLQKGLLPFAFDRPGKDSAQVGWTNAFFHLGDPRELASIADPSEEERFGPPCTIGLEFSARHDFHVSQSQREASGAWLAQLFWRGVCPAGTQFRIRIAHPTHGSSEANIPAFLHLVEASANGITLIRFTSPHDPTEELVEGSEYPRRSKAYELFLSNAILGTEATNTDLLRIASILFQDEVYIQHADGQDQDIVRDCFRQAKSLVRDLLEKALETFYFVSAIRIPSRSDEAPASTGLYVGPRGEIAWDLQSRLANHWMRQTGAPTFAPKDIDVAQCHKRFLEPEEAKSAKIARLLDKMQPEDREQMSAFLTCTDPSSDWAASIASILNRLLGCEDLYDSALWSRPTEVDEDAMEGEEEDDSDDEEEDEETEANDITYDDAAIPLHIDAHGQYLTTEDRVLLNRILIEDTLCDKLDVILGLQLTSGVTLHRYTFIEYVSYWTSTLSGTRFFNPYWGAVWNRHVGVGQYKFLPDVSRLAFSRFRPTGFLLRRGFHLGYLSRRTTESSVLGHDCFGTMIGQTQLPEQTNAGFHQLLPIVVQLGICGPGDVVAVENPEVHLHPSMQLGVADMFLQHATTGRKILIETHSDLFIRRVMRSVLSEDISQESVRIYFVDLTRRHSVKTEQFSTEFAFSTLSPLRVNEKGQIDNWPDGFLNDDLHESQRLIDVMYGKQAEAQSDDDE